MSVVQSEYVRDVFAAVPEPVSYLSAKRSRDVLMTVLLVRCRKCAKMSKMRCS